MKAKKEVSGSPKSNDLTALADERPARIMVIDDDQLVLEVVREFLLDSGYDVSTATSGEEAIERFEREKADIIMVDFKMTGIDGLTTIERLTEIAPATVSILMTGFPTLDSSIQAIKLGASDYILKPFKLDEVSNSIQKAVREWKMKGELDRLKERITRLEDSISEKKDNIKFNKKVEVRSGGYGYSTEIIKTAKEDKLEE